MITACSVQLFYAGKTVSVCLIILQHFCIYSSVTTFYILFNKGKGPIAQLEVFYKMILLVKTVFVSKILFTVIVQRQAVTIISNC